MPGLRTRYALVLAACFLTTRVAHAGDEAKAEALFKQGRSALEAGDYSRACELLERSFAEVPAGGALLNLAFCHQMTGKAWQAYREYDQALKQSLPPDRRSFAEKGLAQVARKLPHVQLELGDGPTPHVEYEDGTVIESPQKPFPVEPGRRTIRLHTPGASPRTVTFDAPARAALVALVVTAGEATTVEKPAAGATTPGAGPSPLMETPHERRTLSVPGLAVTGLGVVGVGLGAFFGLRSLSIRDSACASEACDEAGLARIRGGATTTATISTVSFIAGAAALAGGALLLLSDGSAKRN